MDNNKKIKAVYTAHSKHNFFARKMISAYVLNNGYLPLNPFTNWDYFLDDMVDRDLVVRANNNLIYRCDELWQFGIISDGCYHEIELAMKLEMKIRFFSVGKSINNINELKTSELQFEDELANKVDIAKFIKEINTYINNN